MDVLHKGLLCNTNYMPTIHPQPHLHIHLQSHLDTHYPPANLTCRVPLTCTVAADTRGFCVASQHR